MTRTDESGMKNAAGLISDLATSFSEKVRPYSDKVVMSLLMNLNNNEVDIDSKLVCIVAIGDLIMASGASSS